jgi:hypothetical protein
MRKPPALPIPSDFTVAHANQRRSYTHHFEVTGWGSPEWKTAWPKLLRDASLVLASADVSFTGPRQSKEEVTPPIIDEERGIIFNGVGDEGHEEFRFCREKWAICKTVRKPYDIAVACILLRAHSRAPTIWNFRYPTSRFLQSS